MTFFTKKINKDENYNLLKNEFHRAMHSLKYYGAVKRYERFIATMPILRKNNFILLNLATLYDHLALKSRKINRKKYEEKAISLCKEVLRRDPENWGAVWGIGRVWWHRGSLKGVAYAKRAREIAAKKKMDLGMFSMQVGYVYESAGYLKKAKFWIEKGIKENPNEPVLQEIWKNFKKQNPSIF